MGDYMSYFVNSDTHCIWVCTCIRVLVYSFAFNLLFGLIYLPHYTSYFVSLTRTGTLTCEAPW